MVVDDDDRVVWIVVCQTQNEGKTLIRAYSDFEQARNHVNCSFPTVENRTFGIVKVPFSPTAG